MTIEKSCVVYCAILEGSLQRNVLWQSSTIASAVHGQEISAFNVTGVSLDSRTLQPGDLFIALVGPIHDGHQHVAQALQNGAAGALVSRIPPGLETAPLILVENTETALYHLGQAARNRSQARLLAVTGSFGKTTVKEALRHVLSAQAETLATYRSFNNHWGVPLTLCQLPETARYGVFELGMNHPGELGPLSQQVRPHVSLITAIGKAHYEHFQSIEAIARAKAEIFEGMQPGQIAILNQEDAQFELLRTIALSHDLSIRTFGLTDKADFYIQTARETPDGFDLTVVTPDGPFPVHLNMLGDHWLLNATAILAAVNTLGANMAQAAEDLSSFQAVPGRGRIHKAPYKEGQITLIDESYNASPQTMAAAIKILGRLTPDGQGRRVAILGDMLELGPESAALHQALLDPIQQAQVQTVFTCGAEIKALWDVLPPNLRGHHAPTVEELLPSVKEFVAPNDILLIKGSRGQRAYEGRMQAFVTAFIPTNF